jgi:hypothetical protein
MSIRHIVMWKLASEAPEEKLAQAEEMRAALEGLNGVVPTLRSLTVRPNALFVGANYDVVLDSTFDDADGLAAYAAHPAHEEAAKVIKKYAAERTAVDYEF